MVSAGGGLAFLQVWHWMEREAPPHSMLLHHLQRESWGPVDAGPKGHLVIAPGRSLGPLPLSAGTPFLLWSRAIVFQGKLSFLHWPWDPVMSTHAHSFTPPLSHCTPPTRRGKEGQILE